MAIYYNGLPVGLNLVVEKLSYVEVPSGSTINDIDYSGSVTLTKPQVDDLLDAVNYRTDTFDDKSITLMINELKKSYYVDVDIQLKINEDVATTWTRPRGWPDLDSLNLEMSGNTDFIYMTYATNRQMNNIALYFTGTGIQGHIGYISNGTFIPLELLTITNSNYFYKSLDDYKNNYDYVVVRITGTTITRCRCVTYTLNDRTQAIKQLPILERIAYVPHIVLLAADSGSLWGTYTLEREKINNGDGNALTYLAYAYDHCHNLKSLDISGLKTLNATTMTSMFNYCPQLAGTLDLKHFDVAKVTSFSAMFYECQKILGIDLTGWVTTALTGTGLNSMFGNCCGLKYIYGIENFNTAACTLLSSVFTNCRNLLNLNLINWNTNLVTTIASLFYNCTSLLDLSFVSNWSFDNLTNIASAFYCCRMIKELDLHTWNVSNVTNVSNLFSTCINLKLLNITGWSLTKLTNMSSVFSTCYSLKHIDLSGWHITNTCTNVYSAFYYCTSLEELDIPNDWNLTGITTGSYLLYLMFAQCWSLKRITGIANWHFNATQSLASMFLACYSLETLDVSGWDVSKITNFSSMFNGCYSLKTLDISSWDTSASTTFASMFNGCYNLKTLNVSGFNTSKVTALNSMFANCYSLVSIGNINNWDVSNVTTMASMFRYCYSLNQNFNLSSWNVAKVTTAATMFSECYALEEFTANNWNLAVCTTVAEMFNYCKSLKTLTLNNWCSTQTNLLLPKLSTNPGSFAANCYSLENYSGPKFLLNHTFANDWNLSYESVIDIVNNLPTVSSKTIGISSVPYNQLSSSEKAGITNKGWTRST